MTHFLSLAADICLDGALFGCAYMLTACLIVLRSAPADDRARSPARPITILKPLHGAEPGLFDRLAAFCTQNYAAPVQLVFGAQDASDPAIETVKRLQEKFRTVDIALQVNSREFGSNRKISNLINMLSLARYDTLVVCDSDIEVGPDYLADVVAGLASPDVGVVTSLYHGIAAGGLWTRFSALSINTHLLPQVLFALRFSAARPCFGATIALRRSTLKRIGGFEAFANVLADDYAIGEAVRACGYKVAISAFPLGHVCCDTGVGPLVAHEIRAARTIKCIDPVGFTGTVVTHPVPLALIALMLGAGSATLVLALAIGCRTALCVCVERAFSLPRQPYWLIPLHDLLAFSVYASSFMGAGVSWRGHKYRLMRDGTLTEERASGAATKWRFRFRD
jgi:ceramide glucosyltransferase